jgi:hypothetical protein
MPSNIRRLKFNSFSSLIHRMRCQNCPAGDDVITILNCELTSILRHWREDSKLWQSAESFLLRQIIYTLAARVYRMLLMQMKHAVNSISAVTQSSLHMLYWGVALDHPMGVWGEGGQCHADRKDNVVETNP